MKYIKPISANPIGVLSNTLLKKNPSARLKKNNISIPKESINATIAKLEIMPTNCSLTFSSKILSFNSIKLER